MHLSRVKLLMNSILDPRGFDFGTCDLDLWSLFFWKGWCPPGGV